MRLLKLLLLLFKKLSFRRNIEILFVILMLVILSNSELLGLLTVKETISSITNNASSDYVFLKFIYKFFPDNFSYVQKNALLLILITSNTLFFRIFSSWCSLRIVAKTNNDIATFTLFTDTANKPKL